MSKHYLPDISVRLNKLEEQELLSIKDQASVEKLVKHYWPLVIFYANQISYKQTMMPDLIQEGVSALILAIYKYNQSYKTQLVTLASYYIKSAMYNFVIRNYSIVSVPNYESFKRLQAMNQKLLPVMVNQDINIMSDMQDIENQLIDVDMHCNQTKFLNLALESLDERERDIVLSRLNTNNKVSLKDLGKKYNISAERVRQIYQRSFEQIKQKLIEWRSVRATIPRSSA